MKYLLTLILIIFATDVFAQNVFNPVVIDDYKALDTQSAIEYLQRNLNPKFPKDTQINIDDIVLSGEHFKMISFYYSEYDGTTRGTSQYFISFWKYNKEYFTCTGSNLLNIYNPVITVSNNIINIKAYKVYKPLSIYYYSFMGSCGINTSDPHVRRRIVECGKADCYGTCRYPDEKIQQ